MVPGGSGPDGGTPVASPSGSVSSGPEPRAAVGPRPGGSGRPGRPSRPPGRAGLGSISALAFAFILVPGLAAYVVLHAAGLAIGPAGLLGLLVMFVCLGFYPSLLLRLGWVPPRRRKRS